jgi:acetyltransferase-like isoleucine patch superfamily enzyme
MKYANISLGQNVEIDPSSSVNNVTIRDNVKIAKRCSIFGHPDFPLEIGAESYVGMNGILEGFSKKITIGTHVSIAPNVHVMSGSGPNASKDFQRIFPIVTGEVFIGDHTWIGAGAVIMPGVHLGRFCIVAANSFVNKSFPDFAIIGGCPAKVIRMLTEEEKNKVQSHD